MRKLLLTILSCCLFVGLLYGQEKKSAGKDVWKELKVKVGALIKLSALFEDPHGQSDNNHYFKVDHVFINIKGSFAKDFRFFVQPHYSQYLPGGGTVNGANMFVDYVGFPIKIRVGKFMYPGSLGAFTPASKMDFTTRPVMSTDTVLPQCRDIGVMLFGDALKRKLGERNLTLRLFGSVTNGKQPRTTAMGEGLMYTMRAELHIEKLFSLGACYLKDYQEHELGQIPAGMGTLDHLRFGSVDATLFLGPIRLGGEFLHGWCVQAPSSYHFEGFYAKMFLRFWKHAEIGARYELWDRNRTERYKTEVVTVALNILLNPKNPHAAKIQVNWRKLREGDPSRTDKNALQVLLQICF